MCTVLIIPIKVGGKFWESKLVPNKNMIRKMFA